MQEVLSSQPSGNGSAGSVTYSEEPFGIFGHVGASIPQEEQLELPEDDSG